MGVNCIFHILPETTHLKIVEFNDKIKTVIRLTDISGIDHMKYNESKADRLGNLSGQWAFFTDLRALWTNLIEK